MIHNTQWLCCTCELNRGAGEAFNIGWLAPPACPVVTQNGLAGAAPTFRQTVFTAQATTMYHEQDKQGVTTQTKRLELVWNILG